MVSSEYHLGLYDIRNVLPLVLYGGMAIGAMAYSAIQLKKETSSDQLSYGMLLWLVGWWVIPALLLYGMSHVWKPAYFSRYLIYSIVPPFLMSGLLISLIKTPRLKALLIGVMVFLALTMGHFNTRQPYRAPLEWIVAKVDVTESAELMLFSQFSEGNKAGKVILRYLTPGDSLTVESLADSDMLSDYIVNLTIVHRGTSSS